MEAPYLLDDFEVGKAYKIKYKDIKCGITKRKVFIVRNKHNLQCFCFLRSDSRNFNPKRILKARKIKHTIKG